MRQSLVKGGSFGLTSGVITTMGLLVGLHSGTHSRIAIVGGIATIAVADAFSEAFGMHVSQESDPRATTAQIWLAAGATFATKFVFAVSFLVPVLLLDLTAATFVGVAWGCSLLIVISYWMARKNDTPPWKSIFEHLVIATLVITANHFVGVLVSNLDP
jgi:VIT1/CCC1 family predicted Fe2+/Mn2+ transporter